MKYLIIFLLPLLTGCYQHIKCVDGEIWVNADPMGVNNIYNPTNRECKVIK